VIAQVWLAPAAIAVFAVTASGDVGSGLEAGVGDVGLGLEAGVGDVGLGLEAGVGLGEDAHAVTSSPTARVVATRESEERIPCPPDGVSR
jgi:hypothetical protein